jgi:hypothetical protein
MEVKMSYDKEALERKWTDDISKVLVGRKIVKVRYMNDREVEEFGWSDKAIILILDDKTAIWPSADDEGNNAGAIFTTLEELSVLPVI